MAGKNSYLLFSWICFIFILTGLPVITRLSGWTTILLSCYLVYWLYKIQWERIKETRTKENKNVCWMFLTGVLIIGSILILYFTNFPLAIPEHSLLRTYGYWPGFIMFFIWILSVIYIGVKNKRYSTTGGVFAFTIFTCWSFPFILPAFWALILFLSAICITDPMKNKELTIGFLGKPIPYAGSVAAIITLFVWYLS